MEKEEWILCPIFILALQEAVQGTIFYLTQFGLLKKPTYFRLLGASDNKKK